MKFLLQVYLLAIVVTQLNSQGADPLTYEGKGVRCYNCETKLIDGKVQYNEDCLNDSGKLSDRYLTPCVNADARILQRRSQDSRKDYRLTCAKHVITQTDGTHTETQIVRECFIGDVADEKTANGQCKREQGRGGSNSAVSFSDNSGINNVISQSTTTQESTTCFCNDRDGCNGGSVIRMMQWWKLAALGTVFTFIIISPNLN